MSKTKKLSKVLALVIMLALVIGILPMGTMATNTPVYVRFFNNDTQIGSTVSVTASGDTAYWAIVAGASANSSITSISVDGHAVHSFNGLDPIQTESNLDAILYTVDDVLCPGAVGLMPVSAGSVITVFYVSDYTSTLYASIVPDGAATSGYAIAADNGDTVYYRVETSTVDFANLYATINSSLKSQIINANTTDVTDTYTVTDYTVIPAYKPVVTSSSTIFAAWKSDTIAAYGALTTTQQSQITSGKYAAASANNATMTEVNSLAYEVAPLTRDNSKDLKRLSFSDSEGFMAITQTTTGIGCFDPDETVYELETATGNVTIHAEALSSGATVSYSGSSGMSISSSGVISFSATGTYTLTVTVTNSGTKSYTVSITYAEPATSGVPEDVCGYLPVGQFARGNGWGALYTDSTNTGTTKKFLSGYASTGVSLGLLGGYVQFDLGATKYITDTSTHPYGVDFIVYGNPFSGNPEAGAVMVSEDGKVWYNLAGSLHYDSNTIQNMDISYMKINSTITIGGVTFTKGIWYSTDYEPTDSTVSTEVDAAIAAANWTSFVTGTAWWPEYTDESYGNVWGELDGHLGDHTDSNTTGDIYWNTSGSAEVITYRGVTRVKDDAELGLSGANATNYYRFGYADVRQAGSSYGTAVNPYDTLPAAAAGGDGFDLAWAVNDSGIPVNMSGKHIRFIRVYSAVLYNAGIFGETSAEVCGLYIATGTGSGAPTTQTNSLYITGPTTVGLNPTGGVQVQAGNYTITSNATYIFVNGAPFTSGNTVPVSAGNPVQIITQTGTEAPRVVLLYV